MTKIDIDYDKLFLHVKNLKKVLLVATGRTGSDFFQSLLDSHPEILQFPGAWFFHQWWQVARCKNNVSDLVNEFIWLNNPTCCNHIAKFKSFYNTVERWDKLGDAKNDYFEVESGYASPSASDNVDDCYECAVGPYSSGTYEQGGVCHDCNDMPNGTAITGVLGDCCQLEELDVF